MTHLLVVSTSYPSSDEDWKGRFIADMVQALANRSDLEVSLWAPPGKLPSNVVDVTTTSDKKWLDRLMSKGGIAAELRRGKLSGLLSAASLLFHLHKTYKRVDHDMVHVNWLQNALPLWGTHSPALITVLGSDYRMLDTPGMVSALRAIFSQRPVVLAPNANWMVPKLKANFGDLAKIEAVPFGVVKGWFEVDRSAAESGCWLAVTRLTKNKIGDLFEWGEGLFGLSRRLHLFGPMQEQIHLPDWVIWHGPSHPSELQKDWFPKATGLISLSRHDEGRPQVMLEAMAAGLPIVASDLPAHCDLINHGETGFLVKAHSELKDALAFMENMDANHRIGLAARSFIKREFGDWDDCVARYAALYRELGT